MLETKDLVLRKAKLEDWKGMYLNVWRHQKCARHMMWRVCGSEAEARSRIEKAVEYQKNHDTYVVCEKESSEVIGFAGFERVSEGVFSETGICIGADFQGKGYGKQVLTCLIEYVKARFGAKEFLFSAREANEAAKGLAGSLGFDFIGSEEKTDIRSGQTYMLQKYRLVLSR